MIDIKENFLPVSFSRKLIQMVESVEFPWFFFDNSATDKPTSLKRPQFVHTLYTNNAPNSQYFDIFFPFLYFIEDKYNVEISDIVKVKINFLQNKKNSLMHLPHIDVAEPGFTSFVYYLNNSDGDTVIYNEFKNIENPSYYENDANLTVCKCITPVFNNIVKFNSDQYHSYYNPIKSDSRYVINIVLKLI